MVFKAIIIFASYLGSASSYLPFHRDTRAALAWLPDSLPLPFVFLSYFYPDDFFSRL